MKRILVVIAVLAAAAAAVWFGYRDRDHRLEVHAPRQVVWLDTGLTADEQRSWHHVSEGSELMPFSVLLVLNNVRTGRPFVESLADYGFLVESDDAMDLPVGWTQVSRKLGEREVPFIGINCAACHTGEIRHDGKVLRIDGAPNLFALEAFFNDLRASIEPILADKLKAFLFVRDLIRETHVPTVDGELLEVAPGALSVLETVDASDGLDASESNLVEQVGSGFISTALGGDAGARSGSKAHPEAGLVVEAIIRDADFVSRRLHSLRILAKAIDSGTPLGPGRGDSFGIIRDLLYPDDPVLLDAPVSTPALFGFQQFTWLHWDGNTRGVLGRNIAQAVALGADFDPETFRTSVNLEGLERLEEVGRKLRAPKWPEEVLGRLDPVRIETGRGLFATHCASCHTTEAVHPVAAVGTTPKRAESLGVPLGGRPFAEALTAFSTRVTAVALEQHGIPAEEARRMERGSPAGWRATGGYIARSLEGIWASPPYLHNGSVPTLHDLLLPAAQRPKAFPLGHREFDPVKVGFTTEVTDPVFVLDTTVEGNGNGGHEFGTSLGEAERGALLEYLKSL